MLPAGFLWGVPVSVSLVLLAGFAVNLVWVEFAREDNLFALRGDFAEETRFVTKVAATGPSQVRLNQQGVPVTVKADLPNDETMSGGFSLGPKLLPPAAEEGHVAGAESLLVRLQVHISQHQHSSVSLVLNNCRDQSVLESHLHFLRSSHRSFNQGVNLRLRASLASGNEKSPPTSSVSGPTLG